MSILVSTMHVYYFPSYLGRMLHIKGTAPDFSHYNRVLKVICNYDFLFFDNSVTLYNSAGEHQNLHEFLSLVSTKKLTGFCLNYTQTTFSSFSQGPLFLTVKVKKSGKCGIDL